MWDWLVPPTVAWEQGRLVKRVRQPRAGKSPAVLNPGQQLPLLDSHEAAHLALPAAAESPAPLPLFQSLDGHNSVADAVADTAALSASENTSPNLLQAPFQGMLQGADEPAHDGGTHTVTDGSADRAAPLLREFHHPQANHSVQLCGVEVGYRLERARRRTIGFTVGADGLAVRVPGWTTQGDIERALHSKGEWIVRKLHDAHERELAQQASRIDWAHGGTVMYLGTPMVLQLGDGDGRHKAQSAAPGIKARRSAQRAVMADGSQRLYLPVPQGLGGGEAEQVRAVVQAWMLREARALFTARLQHFAPQLGVQWSRLRLTSARTRWGSASTDGSIRLNWRLMQHAPQVIDYVVVHELAHLRHMDHSPQFWQVVASVLPDWQAQRSVLKDVPLPPWD